MSRAHFLAALAAPLVIAACSQGDDGLPVPEVVDPPVARGPVSDAPPPEEPASPNSANTVAPPPAVPLPPPPPPPAPPSVIDNVKQDDGEAVGPSVLVKGAEAPREALFLHLIQTYRASEGYADRPMCLQQLDAARVARIAARAREIFTEDKCGWKDGGVVLASTGERAMFVHAAVDCSGKSCAAEGGATYGNLGAEGYGYRLRRTNAGWEIQKLGIMWIS